MDLEVKKREKFGKATKALRAEGLIPAEVYGHGEENAHLSVDAKSFAKVFQEAGENTIINLVYEGNKWPVLIYDVQRDGISGGVAHVDFYKVKMTEKIRASVPLEFIGEAPAVKEKLGVLNRSMSEVEVEVLPADLPHRIEVDLSLLTDLEKNIHISNLKVPSGVRIVAEPEAVVATVVPVREEEVSQVPTTEDVSAVKVEGEEKRAEKVEKEGVGEENPKKEG